MFRIYGGIGLIFGFLAIVFLVSDEVQAECPVASCDLEPVNFTFSPQNPVQGEPLEISFDVINNGLGASEQVRIIVWNSTSECYVESECVPIHDSVEPIIDSNKQASIKFTCNPGPGPDDCGGTGDRVLTIAIDPYDNQTETDEDNNRIVYEFTIYSEPLANLKGVEGNFAISITPENPAVGDTVDILALFENNGRKDCPVCEPDEPGCEPIYYIEFRQILDGNVTTIVNVQMREIVSQGESRQINISWVPDEVGDYTIQIVLDSNSQIDEFYEDDNIFDTQVTIRAHTSELTLDESWNLTVDPNDSWLDLPYQDHAVSLVIQVLNEDYVVEANNVRIGFYDIPEGGTESLIGYSFIDNIANATRRGQDIIPGVAQSSITWDKSSGTDIQGNHTLVVRIDPLDEIEEWEENDNNFTFEVEIFEAKPDMTVYEIAIEGQAVRGIPSNIIITTFNTGAIAVSNCIVELRVDGKIIDSWQLSLEEGEFYNITGEYTWNEQQPSVSGHMDAGKVIDELDESNNVKSLLINVATPDYDLTLVSVDSGDSVFKGDSVGMIVQVRNNMAGIPSFELTVYLDNSSSPEVQGYDFEGNPVYYIPQEDLLYEEVRFVTVFWKTTSVPGFHNLTIVAQITNSDFEDQNLADNSINTTVFIKPKNHQLSVEMIQLPSQIYLNETLKITVSALNFGPEICCECPESVTNMENASIDCIGAEISIFIDGALLEIYQTKPLGRVNGEEIRVFYWQPTAPGTYYLEAIIDPDNVIDEYNELDNRAYAEVNVTVEEFVVVEPEEVADEESFFDEPLIWAPLIVLGIAGIGMFVYSRLGEGDDYLEYYEESDNAPKIGGVSQQSGFRYDPETGETYNSETGEVIESGKKD
jgi:subtilase family serine protease